MENAAIAAGLIVSVADRDSMEQELDAAVSTLQANAAHHGKRGILVTRHTSGSFTVAFSDDVPFGLTRELDLRI